MFYFLHGCFVLEIDKADIRGFLFCNISVFQANLCLYTDRFLYSVFGL